MMASSEKQTTIETFTSNRCHAAAVPITTVTKKNKSQPPQKFNYSRFFLVKIRDVLLKKNCYQQRVRRRVVENVIQQNILKTTYRRDGQNVTHRIIFQIGRDCPECLKVGKQSVVFKPAFDEKYPIK